MPYCGNGVTVPISIKPKPNFDKVFMYSPFSSIPAATPILLLNVNPMHIVFSLFLLLHKKFIKYCAFLEFKYFNVKI